VEVLFESVVRDHSKDHAMTALTFSATRSPSYPNTTLPDATPKYLAALGSGALDPGLHSERLRGCEGGLGCGGKDAKVAQQGRAQ
jgi:hypothetical protein